MLSGRSLQSVCFACRHRLLSSAERARGDIFAKKSLHLACASRPIVADRSRSWYFSSPRYFQSSHRPLQESPEHTSPSNQPPNDDLPPPRSVGEEPLAEGEREEGEYSAAQAKRLLEEEGLLAEEEEYSAAQAERSLEEEGLLAEEEEPLSEGEEHLSEEPQNLIPSEAARHARNVYGDLLPKGHLGEEELKTYERLYGTPLFTEPGAVPDELIPEGERDDVHTEEQAQEEDNVGLALFKKSENGELVEVEYDKVGLSGEVEDINPRLEQEEGEEVLSEEEQEIEEEEESIRAAAEDAATRDVLQTRKWTFRSHPNTEAGKFATFPATVHIPQDTVVLPTKQILSSSSNKHLQEMAARLFRGRGMPDSLATPKVPPGWQQRPVALTAGQSRMGQMEADVFLATMFPGLYAQALSVLIEIRKRLGSGWIENMTRQPGGPTVLDASAGGAGVLAWNEVLKAEWSRLTEKHADLKTHGPNPPCKSTVVTGPDPLRHRVSRILDNTQFIPRLPETVMNPETDRPGGEPRKQYDIIFAPNSLWGLKEEWMRKEQVSRFWSLLKPTGGVLILIEKGLPRGFEIIGDARDLLLNRHISSETDFDAPEDNAKKPLYGRDGKFFQKETGMIVAPCTNHVACPLYKEPGENKGRKDFCSFTQRYIRPPYLQHIIGGSDRNHEDVNFSYIAVQRGRDQRKATHDPFGRGVTQGDIATDAAFEGHKESEEYTIPDVVREGDEDLEPVAPPPTVNTLSLPRVLFTPLKRHGHVILDTCTPSGTLERWTVPRSYDKQAYTDARKAQWGDLWALGAKTRLPRNVRVGTRKTRNGEEKIALKKKMRKVTYDINVNPESGEVQDVDGLRWLEREAMMGRNNRERKAARRRMKEMKKEMREEEKEAMKEAEENERGGLEEGEMGGFDPGAMGREWKNMPEEVKKLMSKEMERHGGGKI